MSRQARLYNNRTGWKSPPSGVGNEVDGGGRGISNEDKVAVGVKMSRQARLYKTYHLNYPRQFSQLFFDPRQESNYIILLFLLSV